MTIQLLPTSFKDNKEAHRRLAQAINAALIKSSSTGAVDGLAKTKGNLIAGNGSAWEAVAVGSNGKILTADSSAADGVAWANPLVIGTDVQAWDADLDAIAGLSKTKGNLIAASGSAWQALAVGSNGQILAADSAEADGVKWISPLVIGGMVMENAVSVGTGSSITKSLTGTVERIEIAFGNLSSSASSGVAIRLGTGGTLDTTHYDMNTEVNFTTTNFTGAFNLVYTPMSASDLLSGILTLVHVGSDVWVASGCAHIHGSNVNSCAGKVSLTGPCDIVGLLVGSGVFDSGTWKISYQRSA